MAASDALVDGDFDASAGGLSDDADAVGRAGVAPLDLSGAVIVVAGASGMRVSYFGGADGAVTGGAAAVASFAVSSFAGLEGALAPSFARFSAGRLTNLPSSIGGIFTDTSSPSGFCSVSSSIGTTTATPSASTTAPTRRRLARRRNSSTLMSAGSAIALAVRYWRSRAARSVAATVRNEPKAAILSVSEAAARAAANACSMPSKS